MDEVDHAGRESGVVEHLGEECGGERRLAGEAERTSKRTFLAERRDGSEASAGAGGGGGGGAGFADVGEERRSAFIASLEATSSGVQPFCERAE